MKEIPQSSRRNFLKKSPGLLLLTSLDSPKTKREITNIDIPENPLVFFDNFHSGNRRQYSIQARIACAQHSGFDGFDIVNIDPTSDQWKEMQEIRSSSSIKIWGLHWTSRACIDRYAKDLTKDSEKFHELAEKCKESGIRYISLSLSGTDELAGPNIHESGSAKAEERHWERAYKLIREFDIACSKNQIDGALYPHTHWICDTPQSQEKILDGAMAQFIGPAFCSHHWYANKNSLEIDQTLALPRMKHLKYVVLTNGRFDGVNFPAVPFEQGEIDMAWLYAKLIYSGYHGPISSQGWGIGGDPYLSARNFSDGIRRLRDRFRSNLELWPLN